LAERVLAEFDKDALRTKFKAGAVSSAAGGERKEGELRAPRAPSFPRRLQPRFNRKAKAAGKSSVSLAARLSWDGCVEANSGKGS